MITAVLLALAIPAPELAAVTLSATAALQDPPVRVWLNKQEALVRGDRVSVQIRTAQDGYLIVLHEEPDGRIRVLFPLDPADDYFVRGARDYEIRGRGDKHAFTVYETSGLGTVYAVFSPNPFRFDGFVRRGHWDYTLPEAWQVIEDSEAELTEL